jgi:hypothetical protein
LIDQDGRANFTLVYDQTTQCDALPHLLGRDLHEALLEARAGSLIVGDFSGGDGSQAIWFGVRLTIHGLRGLGEWPSEGGESLAGRWDQGVWGRRARPMLSELAPLSSGAYVGGPLGDEDHERGMRWQAVVWLCEAALLDGELRPGGLQDMRITSAGRAALDPPLDDPLTRARIHASRDAKGDAVNAAVEEELRAHLVLLAGENDVAATVGTGGRPRPQSLAVINEQLGAAGVYSQGWRAEIGGWLALRNEVDHGRGADIAAQRIERMIQGIESFIKSTPSR